MLYLILFIVSWFAAGYLAVHILSEDWYGMFKESVFEVHPGFMWFIFLIGYIGLFIALVSAKQPFGDRKTLRFLNRLSRRFFRDNH